MQDFISRYIPAVAARNALIVFPEGTDARILSAAARLRDEGIARARLLGDDDTVRRAAKAAGVDCEGIEVVNPARDELARPFAGELRRRKPSLSDEQAASMACDPLISAGLMVAGGTADAMIAGAVAETGKVISAGLRTVGLEPEISRLSSYFLMIVPDFRGQGQRSFVFADCAVNIEPTPEELADIAIATQATARKLLDEEPKVALLSFSTRGSASHPSVDRITQAVEIVRERHPGLAIDGELQVDAAVVPEVARRKVKDGMNVAGSANVFVFPDLNSGNIGYKLVQYMANARAIGPLFQGFARPVCDLSRGCTVDDIICAAVLMLATA